MTAKQIDQTRAYFMRKSENLATKAEQWKTKNGGFLHKWQLETINEGIKDIEIYNKLVEVIDSQHKQLLEIEPDFDLLQNPKYKKYAETPADHRDTILNSIAVQALDFYKNTGKGEFSEIAKTARNERISESIEEALLLATVLEEIEKYLQLNPEKWDNLRK